MSAPNIFASPLYHRIFKHFSTTTKNCSKPNRLNFNFIVNQIIMNVTLEIDMKFDVDTIFSSKETCLVYNFVGIYIPLPKNWKLCCKNVKRFFFSFCYGYRNGKNLWISLSVLGVFYFVTENMSWIKKKSTFLSIFQEILKIFGQFFSHIFWSF